MILNDSTSTQTISVQGGTTAMFTAYLHTAIVAMFPYIIAAVVIIIVDLYFGIKVAKLRKEIIRFPTAVRRTTSKAFEYVCWVMLSATLSISFDASWIQYLILGVVMGNELTSIVSHYFEMHGKRIKNFNIIKIIGQKADIDLSDITVEPINRNDNDSENKNSNLRGR